MCGVWWVWDGALWTCLAGLGWFGIVWDGWDFGRFGGKFWKLQRIWKDAGRFGQVGKTVVEFGELWKVGKACEG